MDASNASVVSLAQGLPTVEKCVKDHGRWPMVLDPAGTLGTFFKYKASHFPAFDFEAKTRDFDMMAIRKSMVSSMAIGSVFVLDFDVFKDFNLRKYLNPEFFTDDVTDPAKFLSQETITKVDSLHRDTVQAAIGVDRYIPYNTEFVLCVYFHSDTPPEWAKDFNFQYIKIE
eukprot:CAMPEP_0114993536 /NCGR_PEP_ID=MMETSP0216-20121206/12588_1 /TAXON_ID=223996 /ORGANISM="Protocruzia adherens, Strain Boccale" /LENGTH=170 /DNA_ID=CAMNT_0002357197 /DNA_START=82 /DNA_END=594 /DNA_ORIENTATION=-